LLVPLVNWKKKEEGCTMQVPSDFNVLLHVLLKMSIRKFWNLAMLNRIS
jgi:hypothetical protein